MKKKLQKNIRQKIREIILERKSAKEYWKENPRNSIRKKIHKECLSENLLWVAVPSESTTVNWFFTWSRISIFIFNYYQYHIYKEIRSFAYLLTNISIFVRKSPRKLIFFMVPHNHIWKSARVIPKKIREGYSKENPWKNIRGRIFER